MLSIKSSKVNFAEQLQRRKKDLFPALQFKELQVMGNLVLQEVEIYNRQIPSIIRSVSTTAYLFTLKLFFQNWDATHQ